MFKLWISIICYGYPWLNIRIYMTELITKTALWVTICWRFSCFNIQQCLPMIQLWIIQLIDIHNVIMDIYVWDHRYIFNRTMGIQNSNINIQNWILGIHNNAYTAMGIHDPFTDIDNWIMGIYNHGSFNYHGVPMIRWLISFPWTSGWRLGTRKSFSVNSYSMDQHGIWARLMRWYVSPHFRDGGAGERWVINCSPFQNGWTVFLDTWD